MFDSFLDWLKGNLQKFIDFFDWLSSFIVDFLEDIADFVGKVFVELYNYILEHVAGLVDAIADSVPDVTSYLQGNYPAIGQSVLFCNRFFALDVGFYILSGFLVFVVAFIGIKFALKLIPAIG